MLKKTIALLLLLSLAIMPLLASAEVTNRDMQLVGGVVVSNANDSFFFCPMEEGMTRHWGLYALSSASRGPIVEIQDGYPARLVHADSSKVYFFGYTDASRTTHALYSVEIATGAYEMLLGDISAAFVGDSAEKFFFVTNAEPYYLCEYNIASKSTDKIKDMASSKKAIYDVGKYEGKMYFLTQTEKGDEDGYSYNESSGKAINLDKPSPKVATGMLYEGYRVYASDAQGTQVYSMKLGAKKSARLGQSYMMSLSNPRFGGFMYTYDGENNALVGLPLDGSAEVKLALQSDMVSRLVLGGSKDELLMIGSDAIWAITPNLSGQTRLFTFDTKTGAQAWSHVVPGANGAVFVMGYGAETMTHSGSILPTGVYAYSRSTGEMLFGYPEYDPTAEPVQPVMPEVLGQQPVEEDPEETYFTFSN